MERETYIEKDTNFDLKPFEYILTQRNVPLLVYCILLSPSTIESDLSILSMRVLRVATSFSRTRIRPPAHRTASPSFDEILRFHPFVRFTY